MARLERRMIGFHFMQAAMGMIKAGTSTAPLTISTTPTMPLYLTNAETSGNIESIYVKTTLAGAGTTGGRARFHTYSNVASGTWINAIKAHMDFGSAGSTTGLASAVCAELTMPDAAVGTGHYFPLELEWIGGTSSGPGVEHGFMTARATGTRTNFNASGYFLTTWGLTVGAAAMLSLTSQTLKCRFGASTTRYMVMSQMADGLGLGVTGNHMVLTTAATKAIHIYTTTAVTGASLRICPVEINHARTATAGVTNSRDWAFKVNLTSTHKYGNVANAIYGAMTVPAAGVHGRGAAVQGELVFAAGAVARGHFSAIDAEISYEATTTQAGGPCSFISMIANGGTAADDDFDDSGCLFEIGGLTEGDDHIWDEAGTPAANGTLRIMMNVDTPLYLLYSTTPA